jgi:outer membrane protein
MRFRSIFPALLLAMLPTRNAAGQTGWTLEQCIACARERSPHLAVTRNLALSSELSQQELSTTGLPQTKLSAMALYAPTWDRLGYDPAISNEGEYAGQLLIQQPLYDGGIRGLRSEQLQVESELRAADIRRTERDLLFTVRQGFLDVLRAQQEEEFLGESVRQLEEYLDLVNRLAKGGISSSTDILKTELQLANARISLRRAEEAMESALITLKQAIGLPSDTLFEVRGSIDDLSIGLSDSLAVGVVGQPLTNLDLAQADRELAKGLIDIELTRHEMNPTLSLLADAGLVTSGENLRLPVDQREPIVGFSVGMTLEIPLFTWGASGLKIQQKEIAAENLRLEREVLRRSLDAAIRKLRLQLANAHVRLQMARETTTKAEDNFLLTKSKFAAGATLSLEVLAAQQLLTESKMSELQSLVDVQNIRAQIDQLLTQ